MRLNENGFSLTNGKCYVYLDAKPDGTPFYVGIGGSRRVSDPYRRNSFHTNVRNKYPSWGRTIVEAGNSDQCKELERLIVEVVGRRDLGLGPLVNNTDGGDGVWGRIVSDDERKNNPAKRPENREKSSIRMTLNNPMLRADIAKIVSEKLTGKVQSKATRDKRAESNRGKTRSLAHRKAMSDRQVGIPKPYMVGSGNPMANHETRSKVSKSQQGKKLSKAHIDALRGSHVGNRWIVNVSTGETLMRNIREVTFLIESKDWKYGRKL